MTFIGVDDGEVTLRWPPDAYLFNRGQPDLWCPAFADNGNTVETVLGVSFFIHKNVVFETEEGQLGVAEAICPEHRRPPGAVQTDGNSLVASTELVPADGSEVKRTTGIALLCLAAVFAVAALVMTAFACGLCDSCGQRGYNSLGPGQKKKIADQRDAEAPQAASL